MRTHEKALANALQLRRQGGKHGQPGAYSGEASPPQITSQQSTTLSTSTSSSFAAALSLGTLSFTSQNIKPAKLTLTPHHLFYLLSRFEDLGITVGPMNVRLENLHADTSPANYVSFLSQPEASKGRSDRDSIRSVSSVRSVMSGVSSLWSSFGIGSSSNTAKTEKAKAQLVVDLKYLYSAFTKIPCLRLSPDRKARLIRGYEEFPFDTAVPILAFKNISALEVCDIDFRQFFGWDKVAEQLRSLTVKRAHVDDPTDLLTNIVLDDMDKRRRRSSKAQSSPTLAWPPSPSLRQYDIGRANSVPGTPMVDDKLGQSSSPRNSLFFRGDSEFPRAQQRPRTKSTSPTRPSSSRQSSSYRLVKGNGSKMRRSGSGSSTSSTRSGEHFRTRSSPNLLSMGILPASKWRFLRHLSLADNALTCISVSSLSPLANTLHSLDMSSNLFSEVPDCLATLTALRALNLSNCMIESLHSLARNPLPAITALNLRANRLASIAGVEKLLSLERLDLRDNRIVDPTEIARLTGIPDMREIWVHSNPFVKSHTCYRITIFNLFRSAPGYTEDIVIDSTGPGYSERRQLIDRVPESEAVPIIKALPADEHVFSDQSRDRSVGVPGGNADVHAETGLRPVLQATQSEITIGSGRRRKGPKRRIVDLSLDETQPLNPTCTALDSSTKMPHVAFVDGGDANHLKSNNISPRTISENPPIGHHQPELLGQHRPSLETSISTLSIQTPPALDDIGLSLTNDLRNINLNGETYRRKIEALKDEFGHAWLSVLSEEGWDRQRGPDNLSSGGVQAARPEISDLRATSQGVISGSRTLG